MKRIRKNDEVIVVAGKDKGRHGKVLEIRQDDTIVVENINLSKKTVRPDPNVGEAGGIKEKEAPLHISNVMLFNPNSQKRDRVGFRISKDGDKERYFKSDSSRVS